MVARNSREISYVDGEKRKGAEASRLLSMTQIAIFCIESISRLLGWRRPRNYAASRNRYGFEC